jgi:glycosyltransferase involved in cell wall biosynthesis
MYEVMACGRPILASLEGEAAEILRASGAALVVPPEDVDALAEALARLVRDPALRSELAARGRPYVAGHFDRRQLASRYVEVLNAVVQPTPARAL